MSDAKERRRGYGRRGTDTFRAEQEMKRMTGQLSEPSGGLREAVKKSSEEWSKFHPEWNVIDPDGWDRTNLESSWAELITESEYMRRVYQSTCMPMATPQPVAGDVREKVAKWFSREHAHDPENPHGDPPRPCVECYKMADSLIAGCGLAPRDDPKPTDIAGNHTGMHWDGLAGVWRRDAAPRDESKEGGR